MNTAKAGNHLEESLNPGLAASAFGFAGAQQRSPSRAEFDNLEGIGKTEHVQRELLGARQCQI